jgi:hypothetical protein
MARSKNMTDTERLDWLELHLQAWGTSKMDCYQSTKGYVFSMANKYDHGKPYSNSLREAIDAAMTPNTERSDDRPY